MINVLTTKIYRVTVTELDIFLNKPKKKETKKNKNKNQPHKNNKNKFFAFYINLFTKKHISKN